MAQSNNDDQRIHCEYCHYEIHDGSWQSGEEKDANGRKKIVALHRCCYELWIHENPTYHKRR